MEIETEYAVRLFFPNPAFVQVYYEAIANAFDADATEVRIKISSDGKLQDPDRLSITVEDNGSGFTDERLRRFKMLTEPKDGFHKGLGRLVFLHYFSEVAISSRFNNIRREFVFSKSVGKHTDIKDDTVKSGTLLEFKSFKGQRIHTYDDLKPGSLKAKILEQFLPLLQHKKEEGKNFQIQIELTTDESNSQRDFFSDVQEISANDIPDFKTVTLKDAAIDGFRTIDVRYYVQVNQTRRSALTAANIDGRTIPIKIFTESVLPVDCVAMFLFESELFTGRSDSARQRLDLPEGLSEAALVKFLKPEVNKLLSDAIPEIKTRNKSTKKTLEEKFPHLVGLFDEESVGLINRDEAIESAQMKFFSDQKSVVDGDPSDEALFSKSLEISARSLAEYVLYRDWVIRRLKSTTAESKEQAIHNLIAPRFQNVNEGELVDTIYRNNVWILDDKFMTFRTLLSEKSMSEVVKAITLDEEIVDDGRPDISMVFSADPNGTEKVDVVIVELKRKKLDDKESTYAGAQLVKRARKLVDHCPNVQRVWYYGIVEMDDATAQLLSDMKWVPLHSRNRVFYQDFPVKRTKDGTSIPTPVFLLSYEAITEDALARNHAFLELLKRGFRRPAASQLAAKAPDDNNVV